MDARTDQSQQPSRFEQLFGDLETFDLIVDRVLSKWGGPGALIPRDIPGDSPRYIFDNVELFTPFCEHIRETPVGKMRCWSCDLRATEEAAKVGKPIDYLCDNGLLDIAVPIMINELSIATILFGQRRLSDDPQFEIQALSRLRATEANLGLEKGFLQAWWQSVETKTHAEVEEAKADVDRIAKFVAEIVAEREHLRLQAEHSLLVEAEVSKLSLTQLSSSKPVEDFWRVIVGVFESLCSELKAEAGIILKRHSVQDNVFIVHTEYPVVERPSRHWHRLSDRACQDLIKGEIKIRPLSDIQELCSFEDHFAQMEVELRPEAEAVIIPIESDGLDDVRFVVIFVRSTSTPRTDMTQYSSFLQQKALFDLLASRLKLTYGSVLRYNQRLEFEEERRRYVQDIGHQLIGPLSGLRAHCENLLRGRLSVQRGKTVLETLVEQSGLLQRYARNFGFAARSGRSIFDPAEWHPHPCDARSLTQLLITCTKSFQGAAKDKDLRGPSIDELSFRGFPTLQIDEELFEILILNLFDNAVKYSYESSPITATGRVLRDMVEIQVTNHGIPLDEDQIEIVFDRHTRTKKAEEFAPIGTGIGLFICAQIMKLHKGTIRALPSRKSVWGNEVTIIISLPISKP